MRIKTALLSASVLSVCITQLNILSHFVLIGFNLLLQIEAFRELKSTHGKITHNFRPIQPIGDRVVFYNIDNNYFSYNEIDPDEEETTTTKPSRRRHGHNNSFIIIPSLSVLSLMFALTHYL